MFVVRRNEMTIRVELFGTSASVELQDLPAERKLLFGPYSRNIELMISRHLSNGYFPSREHAALDFLVNEGWELVEFVPDFDGDYPEDAIF